MDENEKYFLWKNQNLADNDLIDELNSIRENSEEIKDRFYKDLTFGTGGLRGIIGAGTNRINVYTIAKATQGLANYLKKNFLSAKVAIAYDSRIKSDLFAKEAARVLAANNIKVFIYKELMPTPALSFAVRHLKCHAGIVITASHNPAEYNGYKVYGSDGCQITLDAADAILKEINKIDIFNDVKRISFDEAVDKKTINYIEENDIQSFISAVSAQALNKNLANKENLNIVYTPLNGSGLKCVTKTLKMNGFSNINVVSSQEKPDGNFPTCPYPNPEIKEALQEGLNLCQKTNADILLATDPDCDRVGIAVKYQNEYQLLSGNEVGVLLFDYICKMRLKNKTMPSNPVCIKTIVTIDMIYPIAQKYGVKIIDVLTGFKFIGEQIGLLEKIGHEKQYIFGFEESYGYLSGAHVRDKDAVNASLLICEMTTFYKNQNLSLVEVLNKLYQEFGYYKNVLKSFTFKGISGLEKMQSIMIQLRENPPTSLNGKNILCLCDYLNRVKIFNNCNKEPINLPASDVLKFELADNISIVIRPSGTEPKLKVYISVVASTKENSDELALSFCKYFENLF